VVTLTAPWPDHVARDDECEMAEWVVAYLANGHITGRELPDRYVWAFARRYWECLNDGHLFELGFRWSCLNAADVIAHLGDCARELGNALHAKRCTS
jgi:hypothetical protein